MVEDTASSARYSSYYLPKILILNILSHSLPKPCLILTDRTVDVDPFWIGSPPTLKLQRTLRRKRTPLSNLRHFPATFFHQDKPFSHLLRQTMENVSRTRTFVPTRSSMQQVSELFCRSSIRRILILRSAI